MSIPKTLFGSTRQVPETDEENWGGEVTGQLADLIDGVEKHVVKSGSSFFSGATVATTTLAAGATLTPTAEIMRVSGNGGAVTLSGTTPIANGAKDGQKLVLKGTSNSNTVTILGSSTNMLINGDVTLADGDVIEFFWDGSASKWQERHREP
jgi:hypothetical protein